MIQKFISQINRCKERIEASTFCNILLLYKKKPSISIELKQLIHGTRKRTEISAIAVTATRTSTTI